MVATCIVGGSVCYPVKAFTYVAEDLDRWLDGWWVATSQIQMPFGSLTELCWHTLIGSQQQAVIPCGS